MQPSRRDDAVDDVGNGPKRVLGQRDELEVGPLGRLPPLVLRRAERSAYGLGLGKEKYSPSLRQSCRAQWGMGKLSRLSIRAWCLGKRCRGELAQG